MPHVRIGARDDKTTLTEQSYVDCNEAPEAIGKYIFSPCIVSSPFLPQSPVNKVIDRHEKDADIHSIENALCEAVEKSSDCTIISQKSHF